MFSILKRSHSSNIPYYLFLSTDMTSARAVSPHLFKFNFEPEKCLMNGKIFGNSLYTPSTTTAFPFPNVSPPSPHQAPPPPSTPQKANISERRRKNTLCRQMSKGGYGEEASEIGQGCQENGNQA